MRYQIPRVLPEEEIPDSMRAIKPRYFSNSEQLKLKVTQKIKASFQKFDRRNDFAEEEKKN